MDELAGRYLTLCLRLSRLVDGLVRCYLGPERLWVAVHAEPVRSPDRLVVEADRLLADIAAEPTLPPERAEWLTTETLALGTRARQLAGDRLDRTAFLERVLGGDIEPVALAVVDAAYRRVGELLGGRGPVPQRLAAYRQATAVAPPRIAAVATTIVTQLRQATLGRVHLPEQESVEVVVGDDGPTLTTDRRGRSRLLLPARPTPVAELVATVAAATYPGEHTVRLVRWWLLAEELGRGECMLVTAATPADVVRAGLVTHAWRALVPRHERELVLAAAYDAAELAGDPALDVELLEALVPFGWLAGAIAAELARGRSDRARLLDWFAQLAGGRVLERLAQADAERTARLLVDAVGDRLVAGYLAKQPSPAEAVRRLLAGQPTPAGLRAAS